MRHIHKHSFILALVLAMMVQLPTAQRTGAQELRFNSGGGPITLDIQSASAGSEPVDATDNSTEIYWDANFGAPSKMTVSTLAPGQNFNLYLLLSVPDQGAAAQGVVQPEVQLIDGMLDTDLMTGIPSTLPGRQGFGILEYRASATVSDGTSTELGDDSHTVTITLLAQ